MKVLKIILICICIISFLLPFIAKFVSIEMQAYYKNQIDDFSKSDQEIREILAKKQFWAQVNDSTALAYSFVVTVVSGVLLLGIKLLK